MDSTTITIITSAVVSMATAAITFLIQAHKLKVELRTEYMVERVIKSLLEDARWKKRSFDEISNRIGGFGKRELERLLVRSGAVRFKDTEGNLELWGLLDRNRSDL